MLLTSYKDTKMPAAMGSMGTDTNDGMETCYQRTCEYAKNTEKDGKKDSSLPPANIRSNSADRIKCYRKGISWVKEEDKIQVMSSDMFKQSAILLIQCVLASVYGEPVELTTYRVDNLKGGDTYPGRKFFLEDIVEALYGKEGEKPGVEMDRNKIICIRHGQDMIGLLSSTGPIPVADEEKHFSIPDLEIGKIEDLKHISLEAIIEKLKPQKLQILRYWLETNIDKGNECHLYKEIYGLLGEKKIKVDQGIAETLEIEKLEGTNLYQFPQLRIYREKKLNDIIALTPIRDEKTPFGYDMGALNKDNVEFAKALRIKLGNFIYAFIPPLTEEAVEFSEKDDFVIRSIIYEQQDIDKNQKVVSVVIRCCMTVKNLEISVTKTYTGGQMRYIKTFPSLSVYGPAPKSGWIVRRDVIPADQGEHAFPLVNEADGINIKDINFDNINLVNTEDDYQIHHGAIPVWLGVSADGVGGLGALPVRVVDERLQKDWNKQQPVFIHKEVPNGTITVAVDIGSSRSVVLFNHGSLKDEDFDIMIENEQALMIPLTISPDTTGTVKDAKFAVFFFQPTMQRKQIRGKTQVGVLTSDNLEEIDEKMDENAVMLYKSGKLMLMDPESISEDRIGRKIVSEIKSEGAKRQKAMDLLIQGILAMIVDRSMHLECSKINIRLAYLAETYTNMKRAWDKAKTKFKKINPECKIDFHLYLPESLAIANRIKNENGFTAGSGAALVDIGDYSTDVALFVNDDDADGVHVKYVANTSVLFAGKHILVEPIWDYLYSIATNDGAYKEVFKIDKEVIEKRLKIKMKESLDKAKNEGEKIRILNAAIDADIADKMIKLQTVGDKLDGEIKNQRAKNSTMTEDGRSCLLYLMDILNKEKLPEELDNLFDIGYLTEVVILKHLIDSIPKGHGDFNVHLFGGGSSFIKSNMDKNSDKEGVFNWNAVLGRDCATHNISDKSNKLAFGLLDDVADELKQAKEKAEEEALKGGKENQNESTATNTKIDDGDFRKGYIDFVKDALHLKQPGWYFHTKKDGTYKEPDRVFNVVNDGIDNEGLWTKYYNDAKDFAKKKVGSSKNTEIIKTLFAYKMAYSCAMAFYKGEK